MKYCNPTLIEDSLPLLDMIKNHEHNVRNSHEIMKNNKSLTETTKIDERNRNKRNG